MNRTVEATDTEQAEPMSSDAPTTASRSFGCFSACHRLVLAARNVRVLAVSAECVCLALLGPVFSIEFPP